MGKCGISDIQFHWNRTFIRLGNRNLQIKFSCLLQLLYLCTNQVRGDVGETVQLLFPVFTVRFVFTPILFMPLSEYLLRAILFY